MVLLTVLWKHHLQFHTHLGMFNYLSLNLNKLKIGKCPISISQVNRVNIVALRL